MSIHGEGTVRKPRLGRQERPLGAEPERLDARKLDYYHALEAEHAGLVLLQGALEGLEDLAAGRILSEVDLERALPAAPAPKSRKSR